MKHLYTPALLALAVSQANTALAQENKLEETIVTSSRVETPLRQVGTSVSVVTAEEINLRGNISLIDTLQYEPSVTVTGSGSAGSTSALRIRGENGFRTKIFIDGIDISDASSPQVGPRVEHLMSAGINRVEILRGPQGMMYGADAGGIINISTYEPGQGFTGGVNAEYGSFNSYQLGGHIGGGNEKGDLSLQANRFKTDGFNSRVDDTVLQDKDGYVNSTAHARAGWNITDGWRAEVVLRQVDSTNEYDRCGFPRTDDCEAKFEQGAGRIAIMQSNDTLTNQFAYNVSGTDRRFFTEGVESYGTKGSIAKYEYIGSWQALDNTKFVYGADRTIEGIDSDSQDRKRNQDGAYLEYQGSFLDALYLTAGLRRDLNQDFGGFTSYRVSGAYIFSLNNGDLKLKGTYGTGFRAPSLYEVDYNNGPSALPPASNTTLKPEESKGYDLGIGYYSNSGWYTELVYFDQRVEDEIYFDLDGFSGYLQGEGESKSRGVELIGEVPFATIWTLNGNYTYNTTKDDDGEPRIRAPKHQLNLALAVRPWNGRFTTSLRMRAARDIEAIDGTLDPYAVFDLSLIYEVLEGLELYGRVENLFNANYQVNQAFHTAGQAGYIGLRYNL